MVKNKTKTKTETPSTVDGLLRLVFESELNNPKMDEDVKLTLDETHKSKALDDDLLEYLFAISYYYKDHNKMSYVLKYVNLKLFKSLFKIYIDKNTHIEQRETAFNNILKMVAPAPSIPLDKPRARILLKRLKELKGWAL